MAMYHWETDQEDFLVLSGAALLIVEGEERLLRRQFGDEYVRYVREVPALVPWPRLTSVP